MDQPWDDLTQEWIECVEPFFPNDMSLAKKALMDKLHNPPLPDWILTLLIMVLFDGVYFIRNMADIFTREAGAEVFSPYGNNDIASIGCEFLNDTRTEVIKISKDSGGGAYQKRRYPYNN